MKKIAVLTSGGDAPGMNAAVRAVTRSALNRDWEVLGIRYGFTGLMEERYVPLDARAVGGILQLGGTWLGSARCAPFETEEGQKHAIDGLARNGVEALVVIGGNGSQQGSLALHRLGFPVVGIASTIDNDLAGSDITIGVDTALNIALESIDRLRTTASSHKRAALVEVMGRKCGYLALMVGIAGGAEIVVIPELEMEQEDVVQALASAHERGKTHALAVVAEGSRHNAAALSSYFTEHRARIGFEPRVTILGHVQRGGTPTAFDRLLATRFGAGAIDALARADSGVLIGLVDGHVRATPLTEIATMEKRLDPGLFELAKVLAK